MGKIKVMEESERNDNKKCNDNFSKIKIKEKFKQDTLNNMGQTADTGISMPSKEYLHSYAEDIRRRGNFFDWRTHAVKVNIEREKFRSANLSSTSSKSLEEDIDRLHRS